MTKIPKTDLQKSFPCDQLGQLFKMMTEWKNHLRRPYSAIARWKFEYPSTNQNTEHGNLSAFNRTTGCTNAYISFTKNKWMGIIKQNFNSLPACPYHKVRLNPPKMQKPGCNSKIQRFFCLRSTASDIFHITGELSFYWSFSLVMRMVLDPSINLWVKISISFSIDIQSSSVLYQSKSLC